MTAFAANQLPADIDSVEKLVAWGSSVLAELYKNPSIVVSPGNSERVAQQNIYYFTSNDPATERLLSVSYLPIADNWRSVGKIYKAAQSLGTSTIPASYLP